MHLCLEEGVCVCVCVACTWVHRAAGVSWEQAKSLSMQLAHDRNERGPHCPDISPRTPQSLQVPWAFHPPHSELNQLTLFPNLLLCLRRFLNISVHPLVQPETRGPAQLSPLHTHAR